MSNAGGCGFGFDKKVLLSAASRRRLRTVVGAMAVGLIILMALCNTCHGKRVFYSIHTTVVTPMLKM